MKKLRAKYEEMLKQMQEDVGSNVAEANDILAVKRQEHTECVNHVHGCWQGADQDVFPESYSGRG